MELSTRWIKILKDLWGHKSRSILVILSIAVGVGAVGMINNAKIVIEHDLFEAYPPTNPSLVQLYVSAFQKDLAVAVAGLPDVESAEARRVELQTLIDPAGTARDLNLFAAPDYNDIRIDKFEVEAGVGVPGVREILLERQTANSLSIKLGDSVTIEIEHHRQYQVKVVGIIHSLQLRPFILGHQATGFVSMETMAWLGLGSYYNQIDLVTVDNKFDRVHVLDVAANARDRIIQPAGYRVNRIIIPGFGADPGQHWAQNQIKGMLIVLQVMGILVIFLTGGLVVNTISAIMTQQIKQIGIMRSSGAVRRQIVGMYLLNVLVLSVLGLLIGLPLGVIGASGLAKLAADVMNFDVTQVTLPINIAALQIFVGLLMPIGVAIFPIVSGTRISVYEAIYEYGLSDEDRRGFIDHLLVRIRNVSPPVMLSLRNTFRNKARLAFTLITLIMAGAMFISAFSTRSSLTEQIGEIVRYVDFDAALSVPAGSNRDTIVREALRMPGITVAEGWQSSSGVVIRSDGSEAEQVDIAGVPVGIKTIDPRFEAGGWLQAGNAQGVVINNDYLEQHPEVTIGSSIILKVNGLNRTYRVLGIVSKHLSGARVYMSYETFAKATGRVNDVNSIRVRVNPGAVGSADEQDQIAEQLEQHFKDAGLSNAIASTQHSVYENFTSAFDVILLILIIMAALLAIVGGLSLTGTMGMNILERTREIGVLRAVGASNEAVRRVVVVEGVVVGLIAGIIGAALSVPVGWMLSGAVIQAVLKATVNYQYSLQGLFIWVGIIVFIGIMSSLGPAQNAVRLSVREVLDYE
jgi:putative ABC transport system permease protein